MSSESSHVSAMDSLKSTENNGRFQGWVRRITLGQLVVGALTLIIGFVVCVPVVTVLLMSFRKGLPGRTGALTLANYREVFLDPFTYHVLLNPAFFAICALAVTLLFAVPIVWLLRLSVKSSRKTVYRWTNLLNFIPPFLRTIGWILLL